MAQNNSFSINLDLDKQKVEDGLKQLGNTIDKNLTNKKLSIQVDEEKLNQQMKAVEAKLKSIENKKIKMDIDDKVIDDQINNLKSKIESIETSKIKAGFDSESAAKEVALLQKDLDKLLSKKTKIAVNVSDAEAEIATLSNMMTGLQDEKAKITVDVDDSDVRDLEESIGNIDDKSVKVAGSADASEVKEFADAIDDLPDDKVVKVSLGGTMTEFSAKMEGVSSLGNTLQDVSQAGTEYASAMKAIQTQTQLTGVELEKFKVASENAYKNGVGENISETTEKMLEARKALGSSASIQEVQEFATQAEAIAKSTGKDYNEVIAASTSAIKNFGVSGSEALGTVAKSFSTIGEGQDVSGTFEEFSEDFSSAGYSVQQFGNLLDTAFEKGADNINKVGDSIQETATRLAAGDVTKGLKDLNNPIADAVAGLAELARKGEITQKEFMERSAKIVEESGIDEATKKNIAAAVSSSMGEDLGANFWKVFVAAPIDDAELKSKGDKILGDMTKSIAPKDVFSQFSKSASLEFAKVSSAVAPMVKSIGAAMTTVGQIAPGLKMIGEFDLKKSVQSTKDFATGIANGTKSLLGLIPATTSATTAQTGLNAAQSANPMGAIILAVVALGAAFYILYQKSEEFRNFIDGIGAVAKDAFNGIMTAIEPLKDTLLTIGKIIFDYVTAPFQILWGVVKGVVEHFKSAEEAGDSLGTKMASLKPIFEKIGAVANTVFTAISNVVKWFIENAIKILVATITGLIDIFISIGTTVKSIVAPIFEWFWNTILKPLVNGISDFIGSVGSAIDTMTDFSESNAKRAAAQSKESLALFKKNREEMNSLASKSFGADTWDDATKQKIKERAEGLKKSLLASASIIQDKGERQKQIDYINNLYNTIYSNINKQKKSPENKNATNVSPTVDVAKVAEAAKLHNDYLKQEALFDARLIANEWDKELKILSINEEFDLKNLALEKKSQEEIIKVKAKYAQDKSLVNEKYRLKEFETAVAEAKANAKELVNISQTVIDEYKSQLTSGDTSVLPAYMTESFKKLNLEHDAQIQEYLDKDKEFIEKQKEISLKVSTGEISQDEGLKQLQDFAKVRLDFLKINNISYQNLLKKQGKENADLIKSLKKDELSAQYTDQLANAKSASEYDKVQSLISLKEKYDADVAAAKGNKVKLLIITKAFWQETAKIESAYREANLSNSLKAYSKLANSFVGIFSNIKVGNNKSEIDSAKSDLASIEDALKELDAQRRDNSISENEYEINQDELLRKKQDALERAGQSYVNFGNIVRAVNEAIIESMTKMVDATVAKNTELVSKMNENEQAKQAIRSKGSEATAEDIEALATLTDEGETLKQEAYMNTAAVFGGTMVSMLASGKSFLKSTVMSVLGALKALIPIYIAQIYAAEIASKSFAGLITAPLLIAAFTSLVIAAEAMVSSMDFAKGGENPYGGFGGGLHRREKRVLLRVAETGRPEYVLNPNSTAKSDIKELDAINKMGISPKQYYLNQFQSQQLDVGLLHKELVEIKAVLQDTKLIDQKTILHNNVTAKVILPAQPSYLSY